MFTNPGQNILQLALTEGMKVADFGAGSGFYSKAASARVGYSGKVYAIEVQKDLVKKLEKDLRDLHISNVECIWGDVEKKGGTKISDKSMDKIIISNVLFQTEDKLGLIDEAKRILKKGGEILLIDWHQSFNKNKENSQNIISQGQALDLFKKRGFEFVKNISISPNHYGIILKYE